MQSTEEVKSGENEKSESHALGIIGSVGIWQVGFETPKPILDVLLLVECRTI